MKVYTLYIKSHDLSPDFEVEVEADKEIEAINMFYEILHGEFDTEFIKAHMLNN